MVVAKVKRETVVACMTCPLCDKLLSESTTISECLHTFCRKCIYEKITEDEIDCCPVCEIDLGVAPLRKLRPDHILQGLRSMIFPLKRRKETASEVVSTIALPAKRKERSISSLVVSTTGKRTKAVTRKDVRGNGSFTKRTGDTEEEFGDDHTESGSSPETLKKSTQSKKQSSYAEPNQSLSNRRIKDVDKPWDSKLHLLKPLNFRVDVANGRKPLKSPCSQGSDPKSERENASHCDVQGSKTKAKDHKRKSQLEEGITNNGDPTASETSNLKKTRRTRCKRPSTFADSRIPPLQDAASLNQEKRNGPVWFSLVASNNQEGETSLPQIPSNYLRIRTNHEANEPVTISGETKLGEKDKEESLSRTNRASNEAATVSGEIDTGDHQINKTNCEANEPVNVLGETDTSWTNLEANEPVTVSGETDTSWTNLEANELVIVSGETDTSWTNLEANEPVTVSGETDTSCTNREANELVTVSGETDTSFHTSLQHPLTGSDEMDSYDPNLPPRLFATDQFPNHTLNIYCKLHMLTFLHQTLKGTKVWETIRGSCFGKLFELPLNTCPISCKLVHSLLTRQLITENKYVLWTVFGGYPLRFSLFEFGEITGLNCGKFPPDHDPDDYPIHNGRVDPYWKQLIGDSTSTTLADIASMLEEDEQMPYSRKLGLALILIVDGVLISTYQANRPTLKYVQMVVKDVDTFLAFPWGRESFLRTIRCMKPDQRSLPGDKDPITIFQNQLKQKSYRLQGFPLVLQLLAFRAIPSLLAKLPPSEPQTLLDLTVINIPKSPCLTQMDVLEVENQPKLKVSPIIDIAHKRSKYWGKWSDETNDTSVAYLERLIRTGHQFTKSSWHGGDDSEPLLAIPQSKNEPPHKKHIVERMKGGTPSNFRPKKHSASATYFPQAQPTMVKSNQVLLEKMVELRLQLQKVITAQVEQNALVVHQLHKVTAQVEQIALLVQKLIHQKTAPT